MSSGGSEVGNSLARPACAADCDMLDNGLNGQWILDSLTDLQLLVHSMCMGFAHKCSGLDRKAHAEKPNKATFGPAGTRETILITHSSVYVLITCSRWLAHFHKLRKAERKRDQGDSIRRGSWIMSSLFRLVVLGLAHRSEPDMAIVS